MDNSSAHDNALEYVKTVKNTFSGKREKYYEFLQVLKDFKAQSSKMNNSSGDGQKTVTLAHAFEYLNTMKHRFANQSRKYDEFLQVMIEFKAQRIGTSEVLSRVKEILKDHNDLLLGFNTFLPRRYELGVDQARNELLEEALQFVWKVEMQASDIYRTFLDILNEYRKDKIAVNQVYRQVADLFRDHPDLLLEFTRFLPNSVDISSANATPVVNRLDLRQEESASSMVIDPMPAEKTSSMVVDSLPAEYERAKADEGSGVLRRIADYLRDFVSCHFGLNFSE